MHDLQNPGVTVDVGESSCPDDAALVNADAATANDRVTALAASSLTDVRSNRDIAGQKQGRAYPPEDARQLQQRRPRL